MFKNLRTYFFTGLLVMLPVTISLKVIFWGFEKVDSILGNIINWYLLKHLNPILEIFKLQIHWKIPGLGLIALLLIITLVGVFARNYLGRKLINLTEKGLNKIPVLSSVYSLTKQITEGFASAKRENGAFRKVVMVEYPRAGIYSPGFLTGEVAGEISEKTGTKLLGVFVPTVPNPTTGFLIFIPEENVTILDMSVEEGFKMFLSAGVIMPAKNQSGKGASGL